MLFFLAALPHVDNRRATLSQARPMKRHSRDRWLAVVLLRLEQCGQSVMCLRGRADAAKRKAQSEKRKRAAAQLRLSRAGLRGGLGLYEVSHLTSGPSLVVCISVCPYCCPDLPAPVSGALPIFPKTCKHAICTSSQSYSVLVYSDPVQPDGLTCGLARWLREEGRDLQGRGGGGRGGDTITRGE